MNIRLAVSIFVPWKLTHHCEAITLQLKTNKMENYLFKQCHRYTEIEELLCTILILSKSETPMTCSCFFRQHTPHRDQQALRDNGSRRAPLGPLTAFGEVPTGRVDRACERDCHHSPSLHWAHGKHWVSTLG